MRKGIIAAIVAVALFAVGAFAATFVITSDEVTSGTDTFSQCEATVSVDFETGAYTAGLGVEGDFPVTGATATFSGPGCDEKVATLAVLDTNGDAIDEVVGDADVSAGTVDFTLSGVIVGDVFGSAVLVEGFPIPAPPAP